MRQLIFLVLLSFVIVACIQTSSEPEIVSTRIVSPNPPTPTEGPLEIPSSFDLEVGAQIYATNCQTCHGEQGLGDGPTTVSIECEMPNFAVRDTSVTLTDWFTSISNGTRIPPDPTCPMPPWKNTLSQEQIWNVTAYTYSFGEGGDEIVAGPSLQETEEPTDDIAVAPSETEVPSAEPIETFMLSGTVTNRTAGAEVPDDLKLELFIIDFDTENNPTEHYQSETVVNDDATFMFTEIPRIDGLLSLQTQYGGITQFLGFFDPSQVEDDTLELDLEIYEVTDDPSSVVIKQMTAFVDAVTGERASLTFLTFEIVNTGDTIYFNEDAAIEIPMPRNATNPQITQVNNPLSNFTLTESLGQYIFKDSYPLFPGEENGLSVEIAYNQLYEGSMIVTQTLPYTTETVIVYVSADRDLQLSSDQLSPTVSITQNNLSYDGFTTDTALPLGTILTYQVTDGPNTPQFSAAEADNGSTATDKETEDSFLQENANIIFGIGILMIVAGGMYLIYDLQKTRILTQAQAVTQSLSKDELIAEIATLDERFEQGKIGEVEYEERRTRLKTALRRYFK